MDFNSFGGDEECLGDLPIGLAACRQVSDSSFGGGERARSGECGTSSAGSCDDELSAGSLCYGYGTAAGREIKGLAER